MNTKKKTIIIASIAILLVAFIVVAFLATQRSSDYYTQIDNDCVTEIAPHGAMNYRYYCIYDASQGYFGKAPIDMTDYECTLLAGIPNAPSVYSLTANPELAEQRQEYVVQRMVQYGYISEDEAQSILQDQS